MVGLIFSHNLNVSRHGDTGNCMINVKEYLEKAYASAMYEGMHVTAELIAAALDTLNIAEDQPARKEPASMENIVAFPYSNQK